jgi:hypothetical protein
MKKRKNVMILVAPEFYNVIEKKRKKYMRKYNIDRLATTKFTKIMANDFREIAKNAKRKKRRRN